VQLSIIASSTGESTKVVIEHGAIPVFIQLLKSPDDDVKQQAVWALGNIAKHSAQYREQVLNAGALQPLLQLCTQDAKITMLRNATWSLSNFCRCKPPPDFALVQDALPVLARLLYVLDDEVLTDACWALSYMSDETGPQNPKIEAVIQCGVARRLVELLMHQSLHVKTAALRTVGNIVTGDDVQTQVILNCSALPCLLALLVNPKNVIRKETCWAISNITAGNSEHIQAVINANIIPELIRTLTNDEFDIQKEAVWVSGREE
jgi:importin subunit alpha-1